MSAIDTFDWYNLQAWKNLDEKTREFIIRHRKLLMNMRSEDQRKRFVFQYIQEVQERNRRNPTELRGG